TVGVLTGVNQAFSQSFNGVTLNPGAAAFNIGPIPTTSNLTLGLGAITPIVGGTILFDATQSTLQTVTTSNSNTNGILGGGAVAYLEPVNLGTTQTAASMGWAAVTAIQSIVPLGLAGSGTGAYTDNV